jgi:protein-tyrosine phosphatase
MGSNLWKDAAMPEQPFVDIHCHLLPGIDDGSKSWDETLTMARMAADDGIRTIIVTPHQLGAFAHNTGDIIRERAAKVQRVLTENGIPLTILPGGDVRIEPEMVHKLQTGEVMSLGDKRKHVLLELPHELYFPLGDVLSSLERIGMDGILSHPERNQGILKDRSVLEPLVKSGCLMQVTAGSVMGTFGGNCQELAEWMLKRHLVHFIATDAHGPKSRRPLILRAFQRIADMVGGDIATEICCTNPARVAAGKTVKIMPVKTVPKRSAFSKLFSWSKSA